MATKAPPAPDRDQGSAPDPASPKQTPGLCGGCGACCMHVGTPPGFAAFFGDWTERELRKFADWATFRAMPEALRGELGAYYAGVDDGTTADRTLDGATPCLWYDGAARRCRHHEHRPAACRGFEVGGGSCLSFRRAAGLA